MGSHSKYVISQMDEMHKDHWEYNNFHSGILYITVYKMTVI